MNSKKLEKNHKINILYIHDRPSGGAGESLYQMIYKNKLWKTKGVFFIQKGYLKSKFESLRPAIFTEYVNVSSWLSSIKNVKWLYWISRVYHLNKSYIFYKKVKSALIDQEIDIIHTNAITVIEGGFVAKYNEIPHFIQVRELLDLEYYKYAISKKKIIKILDKYSDVIIANSERTKDGLTKLGMSLDKIKVVYNAVGKPDVQLDIRDHLHLEKSIKIVAVVGWVRRIKRIEDFIEITKAFVLRKDVKFLIIGGYGSDVVYNDMIRAKISNASNIIHTGIIQNVNNYMNSFDLLISTCDIESFGRTVAEALIEGTPSIGIKTCAVAEIIQHQKSGFLVEKSDIKTMVEYTKLLLDDESLRTNMGAFGEKDVDERFGIEKIRNEFLELYKEYTKD